jgi:carboxymethylenebutenolidase
MRTNIIRGIGMLSFLLLGCAAHAADAPKGAAKDASAATVPAKRVNLPPSGDDAAAALAKSPRHGEWVDIDLPGSDAKLHTFVVYPERKDKAPVVLVIHEIYGMTDWVRGVADALAAEGFVAVAPDLLSGMGPNGGGTESLGEKVRESIQKLKPDDVAKRLDAARAWAIQQPASSDAAASIGFCWGGAMSFSYAARQPKLNAAVVYYGTAPKDKDELAKINAPVLGCYGGDDARVTNTVDATKKEMEKLNKPYEPHVYEGAGHGFLRQQSGKEGKNADAATHAWGRTIVFLHKNLDQRQQ